MTTKSWRLMMTRGNPAYEPPRNLTHGARSEVFYADRVLAEFCGTFGAVPLCGWAPRSPATSMERIMAAHSQINSLPLPYCFHGEALWKQLSVVMGKSLVISGRCWRARRDSNS
jgi:hypothetical protein